MKYFAYGSNMSISRLRARVSSAVALGCFSLSRHDLRFHKASKDGSGKCNAYFTSNSDDVVYGVLFEIDQVEKLILDRAEGLGHGYDEKEVIVTAADGSLLSAVTYVASDFDDSRRPYTWYVNHVVIGAREALLPVDYIRTKISSIEAVEDADEWRDAKERAIYFR
ncbi:gamma-glutamylcyclotransferase [Pseudomonas koreensis]|uniref:gamma-glutamylcyclotransferase family protein n=1 Tax=Pseudomonas koreensis TaxID=198620 RepID=UPI0021C63F3E|nr:gamma-glutamylcyclotransferase family protein [Pseudomonas koreensis]MCU0093418.1 gamma-glutamylcyclotransferase [Pseudomonas koreensis]